MKKFRIIAGTLLLLTTLTSTAFAQTAGDTSSTAGTDASQSAQSGTAQTSGTTQAATTPATPSASAAYNFQSQGIFGCGTVAGSQSVGATAAIGGVYVPVNDAAVTQNTQILIYKECVLRVLVDRERQSAMAAYLKRAQVAIETGNNGGPQYAVSEAGARGTVSDQELVHFVQDGTLDKLDPSTRQIIQRAIVQNYVDNSRDPSLALKCPYTGNINAAIQGRPDDFWGSLSALQRYPQCNPYWAYYIAQQQANDRITQVQNCLMNQLNWGRGFYNTNSGGNPCTATTYTPASVVQESYQQILGSPVRQFENANDVGQMIGALYGGLTTQILSSNQGLYGLTLPIGTQPSYVDQINAEASTNLRGSAVSAALQILGSARQVEMQYGQAAVSISNVLSDTAAKLRASENACWSVVVPQVQTYASQNGLTINVATSTTFSQGVINSQISSLSTTASANAQTAQNALTQINQLIAGLTNTSSLDAQRIALTQLDQLVAQHQLHTSLDANNMQQQLQNVQTAMQSLVQSTQQAWSTSTDPSVGWCNINNPAVPQMWANQWKT